jgi:hypothetical protein
MIPWRPKSLIRLPLMVALSVGYQVVLTATPAETAPFPFKVFPDTVGDRSPPPR